MAIIMAIVFAIMAPSDGAKTKNKLRHLSYRECSFERPFLGFITETFRVKQGLFQNATGSAFSCIPNSEILSSSW
jgi:hypothetical protein